MNKYNDEILTPQNYELLAREYNKSIKKNIKFVEIKVDEKATNNINAKIIENCETISQCLKCLSKNKINSNKKNLLNLVCNEYNFHKDFVEKNLKTSIREGNLNKNYCACLNTIIDCCTKTIKNICEIKDFLNEETLEKYFKQIEILLNIINYSSSMFGVCKYRQ